MHCTLSRRRFFAGTANRAAPELAAGRLSHPHDAGFGQSGRLLVADTGNDRVTIHEIKGAPAGRVGERKGLAGLQAVAATPARRRQSTLLNQAPARFRSVARTKASTVGRSEPTSARHARIDQHLRERLEASSDSPRSGSLTTSPSSR